MIQLKSWIVNTITTDLTMQGYLTDNKGNYNIYPVDIDIQPENFPAVTYQDIANKILTNMAGFHIALIQLNIWSINNALEAENIYERIEQLFNFQHSQIVVQVITGTLVWIKEEGARDFHSPGRRIWHKQLDLKYWFKNTTGL